MFRAFRQAVNAALKLATQAIPLSIPPKQAPLAFRRYPHQSLRLKTNRLGFEYRARIGGVEYLVKHGTFYRADKLMRRDALRSL